MAQPINQESAGTYTHEQMEAGAARMMDIIVDGTKRALDDKFIKYTFRLLEAETDAAFPVVKKRPIILGLGLTAMAEHAMLPTEVPKPYKPIWLDHLRGRVEGFIQEDPLNRSVLHNSVIFNQDLATEKQIGHFVHAANILTRLYGQDGLFFSVGVALDPLSELEP